MTTRAGEERLKVLILSTYEGTDANAVRDYLLSFRLHSRHDYYYVLDCRRLDDRFDLSPFHVIVIFWDVFLLGPELSEAVRQQITRTSAVKVAFLQDEYRDVRAVNQAMAPPQSCPHSATFDRPRARTNPAMSPASVSGR